MATSASQDTQDEQYNKIRISSSGKMTEYIALALKSLEDDPKKPLFIYTAPANSLVAKTSNHTSLHKLVSIVEIVKRQYSSHILTEKDKGKAAERSSRLYQYNKLSNLVFPSEASTSAAGAAGEPSADDVRAHERVVLAIAGEARKRPKMKHLPCMSVILSTAKVNGLDMKVWTAQMPEVKVRKHKKKKAGARSNETEDNTGVKDVSMQDQGNDEVGEVVQRNNAATAASEEVGEVVQRDKS